MSTREPLVLARHYQDEARRSPQDSHFWTARSLYFGRAALRNPKPDDPTTRRRVARVALTT